MNGRRLILLPASAAVASSLLAAGLPAGAAEAPPPPPQYPVPAITPRPTAPPARPIEPVAAPTPRLVNRSFQVVRYAPATAAQRRLVARLDDDGLLRYREDRAARRAASQVVTLRVPPTARPAQIVRAINARTGRVGDVRTTARLRTVTGRVTVAWEVGAGASGAALFGRTGAVPQRFLAHS